MSTKVEVVSRAIERLLPLLKERPTLRAQALDVQKWCGETTTNALSTDDAVLITGPLLAATAEPKDDAIVTSALDGLHTLLSHNVVTRSMVVEPSMPTKVDPTLAKDDDDEAANRTSSPPPSPKNAGTTSTNKEVTVLGAIVDAVIARANAQSEEILINIIRTLLTAVAGCEAHGPILIKAVNTIITILVQTRGSKHTQQTGKATLSQIAGVVQRRTELPSAAIRSQGSDEEGNPTTTGGGGGDSPEWADFVSVLEVYTELISSAEVPRIQLGLTLLGNFVVTIEPRSVLTSNRAVDHIRSVVTARLLPLLVNTTQLVSKPAFELLSKLLEDYYFILGREAGPILNLLYAIAERSLSITHRNLAVGTLLGLSKSSDFLVTLFRNYDCVIGSSDVFAQFCERVGGLIGSSATPGAQPAQEEALQQLAVAATNNIATSIRKYHQDALTLAAATAQQDIALGTNGASTASNAGSTCLESGSMKAKSPSMSSTVRGGGSLRSPLKAVERLDEVLAKASQSNKDIPFSELQQQIDARKVYRAVLDTFAAEPKDGVAMALEKGLCASKSPLDVANFLRTRGIDKVKVGEYLAKNKPEIQEIYDAYLSMNNFTGLTIDEALRLMNGSYKMAGEAQVVDRTMQLFTKLYCAQNPEAFSSEDAAYVLSFSIMMLNTDQHSPNVKEKMTLDQFVSTNRGVNDGKDFPRQFLEGIYWRIHNHEIRLNDDSVTLNEDEVIKATANPVPGANKPPPNVWVADPWIQKTVDRVHAPSTFAPVFEPTAPEVAPLMYAVAWQPAQKALAATLGDSCTTRVAAKCFDGFDRYVVVACELGIAEARRKCIAALATLSRVTAKRTNPANTVVTLSVKHIRCIDLLIRLGTREGNSMGDSWRDILMTVSRAHRIFTTVRAVHQKAAGGKGISKPDQATLEAFEEVLDMKALDILFSESQRLEDEAVYALVTGLTYACDLEFSETPVRTSSFEHMIDIVFGFRGRSDSAVERLWRKVSSFVSGATRQRSQASEKLFKVFGGLLDRLQSPCTALASQETLDSPTSAAPAHEGGSEVDLSASPGPSPPATANGSLGSAGVNAKSGVTQAEYWRTWQKEALGIIHNAAWQCPDSVARGHMLSTVAAAVTRGGSGLHAAWAPILAFLGLCARDPDASLVTRAFFTFAPCVEFLPAFDAAALTELVGAACAFAASGLENVASPALDVLEFCGAVTYWGLWDTTVEADDVILQSISSGDFGAAAQAVQRAGGQKDRDPAQVDVDRLKSILGALSGLATSPSTHLQTRAIAAVFRVMNQYAAAWTANDEWQVVLFAGVAPLFDHLFDALETTKAKTIDTVVAVLEGTLVQYTQLHTDHTDVLASYRGLLFDPVSRCVAHANRTVMAVGQRHLRDWVTSPAFSQAFSEAEWKSLAQVLARAATEPVESLTASAAERATEVLDVLSLAAQSRSALLTAAKSEVLPTLSRAFAFCSRARQSNQASPDSDASATSYVSQYQSRVSITALHLIVALGDHDELHVWARDLVRDFMRAHERSRSASSNEQKALGDAVFQLVSSRVEVSDADLAGFMDVLGEDLCELIRSCEPRIAGALSILFRRYHKMIAAARVA